MISALMAGTVTENQSQAQVVTNYYEHQSAPTLESKVVHDFLATWGGGVMRYSGSHD